MVTRRDVVTAGALGALATTTAGGRTEEGVAAMTSADAQSAEAIAAQSLRDIHQEVQAIRRLLQDALIGPSVASGPIGEIRRQFTLFLRSNQKFPDYCEVGPQVFTDLYDWHVRHRQPLEVGRPDGRLALRFMFTWMILRPEQEPGFVGIPFDRG